MQSLNLNARVRVTLTPTGMRWLRERYAALAPGLEPWQPDANPREFQLWELMQVYGPHPYLGMVEMPFVGNRIEVLDSRD